MFNDKLLARERIFFEVDVRPSATTSKKPQDKVKDQIIDISAEAVEEKRKASQANFRQNVKLTRELINKFKTREAQKQAQNRGIQKLQESKPQAQQMWEFLSKSGVGEFIKKRVADAKWIGGKIAEGSEKIGLTKAMDMAGNAVREEFKRQMIKTAINQDPLGFISKGGVEKYHIMTSLQTNMDRIQDRLSEIPPEIARKEYEMSRIQGITPPLWMFWKGELRNKCLARKEEKKNQKNILKEEAKALKQDEKKLSPQLQKYQKEVAGKMPQLRENAIAYYQKGLEYVQAGGKFSDIVNLRQMQTLAELSSIPELACYYRALTRGITPEQAQAQIDKAAEDVKRQELDALAEKTDSNTETTNKNSNDPQAGKSEDKQGEKSEEKSDSKGDTKLQEDLDLVSMFFKEENVGKSLSFTVNETGVEVKLKLIKDKNERLMITDEDGTKIFNLQEFLGVLQQKQLTLNFKNNEAKAEKTAPKTEIPPDFTNAKPGDTKLPKFENNKADIDKAIGQIQGLNVDDSFTSNRITNGKQDVANFTKLGAGSYSFNGIQYSIQQIKELMDDRTLSSDIQIAKKASETATSNTETTTEKLPNFKDAPNWTEYTARKDGVEYTFNIYPEPPNTTIRNMSMKNNHTQHIGDSIAIDDKISQNLVGFTNWQEVKK